MLIRSTCASAALIRSLLLRRHSHIRNGYGHRRAGGVLVADRFDAVKYFSSLGRAVSIDNLLQDLLQAFLAYVEINFQLQLVAGDGTIYKAQILFG